MLRFLFYVKFKLPQDESHQAPQICVYVAQQVTSNYSGLSFSTAIETNKAQLFQFFIERHWQVKS